ncbi:AAA domain-domain-containing protein [Kockovaella imperatae]|uniref:AAA domain-domain-containing protein n=1 Tax=Kockovaella imperatae TaxID=4999 RepID=A0A1Y1UCD1_9TREE|nr:AAA domain-domain-containing protein [Kockovaella imperatae]ORX35701.1 AAA domain-domain-containing protein [Kockovaella imperatae]
MLQYTYDMMAENHPIYNTMQSFEQERARIYEQIDAGKLDFGAHRRGKELLAKITRLKQAIAQDVLADADVICTTCLSAAGSRILGQIDFPIVFLDEASMATEPLSLIPFMKGVSGSISCRPACADRCLKSSQVAIIGDHKQLPPVITSDAAKFGGLSMSLFERLVHEQYLKDSTVMLDTQYRMHPSIAAFASKQFYNSELKNGTTSVITGKPLKKFDPPVSKYLTTTSGEKRNVMFVDHDSVEMSSDDKSTVNYGEAQQGHWYHRAVCGSNSTTHCLSSRG